MNYEPMFLDKVKQIIKEQDLNTRSRRRDLVYKRMYLYNEIKNHEDFYSFEYIGDLFNRDHATVLHGLRTRSNLIEMKDPLYHIISEEMDSYMGVQTKYKRLSLRTRILNCSNIVDFRTVQSLVEKDIL